MLHSPDSPHVYVEKYSYLLPGLCDVVFATCHARARCFPATCFFATLCFSCNLLLLVTEWICRWMPCWILIDDAFKKSVSGGLSTSQKCA